MLTLSLKHHVTIDSRFVNLFMSVIILEWVGRQLENNPNIIAAALPIIRYSIPEYEEVGLTWSVSTRLPSQRSRTANLQENRCMFRFVHSWILWSSLFVTTSRRTNQISRKMIVGPTNGIPSKWTIGRKKMKETRWLRISLMNANVVYNCNWFLSLFGIRYPVPIKGNRVPMTRNLSPQPQFQSSGFISTKHGMNLARERWSFLLTTNENQRRNVRSCCVGERS